MLRRNGETEEQVEECKQKAKEFKHKSADFADIVQKRAEEGRKQGESITDFKERKLQALNIVANAVNELEDGS